MTKRTLQQHINDNKDQIGDSNTSSQRRRYLEDELEHLEKYQMNHPDTDYDPTGFEMYCDENPDASECKIYED
jgi:hypothetical protein